MDHRQIEEHNIADRYVMRKLSAQERAEFEAHFIKCDQCLDLIDEIEDFRQALQRAVAEKAAQSPHGRTGFLGWWTPLNPWGRAALAAGALGFMTVLATLVVRDIRLRHDLDQAKTASARWQTQLERTRQTASALDKQLQDVQQELAEQRRQLEIQRQGQRPTPHPAQAPGLVTRPQINTPIFVLSAMRSADPSQSKEIVIPPSAPWIVLSLELDGKPEHENYRATIWTAAGRLVWQGSGLQPNRYDALTMSFPSDFFRVGDYLVTLEGVPSQGRPVSVANYSFRVIKK